MVTMNGVAALSVFSLSACRLMLRSFVLAIGLGLMLTVILADDVFADELLDSQLEEQEDPISRDLNAFDIIYPAIHYMLLNKMDSLADDDNDGIDNQQDVCPETPIDETADATGCSVSQRDTDGDGLNDHLDVFPLDPNETSDFDEDGIGNNADPDDDNDGVLDDDDRFPNDPNESSDLDDDGMGDNSDPDRDGDGVLNPDDPFPGDGSVSQLPALKGLSISAVDVRMQLVWLPSELEAAYIAEYRIYRGGLDQSSATLLTTITADSPGFIDTTAENGQAYGYRVTAITTTGFESAATDYITGFVAYNTLDVPELTLTMDNDTPTLSWPSITDAAAYRVERAEDNGAFGLLQRTSNHTIADTDTVPDSVYRYRIATIQQFNNPITETVEERVGAYSLEVATARQDMTAELLNTTLIAANHYEYTVVDVDTVSVSGIYQPVSGSVDIKAQRGDQLLNTTSDDGLFVFELPFQTSGEQWVITITPQSNAINPIELRLTLLADAETGVPVVTLSESTATISGDNYPLTGTVISEQADIDTVIASSSRFVGTEFVVFIDEGDQISADIPILSGENQITVTATDANGRDAQAQVTVTRTVSEAPVIEITAPTGSTTLAESVDITGVVYTSLAAAYIRVTLDRDIFFPATNATDGAYAFAFNQRPLVEGLNTFSIQVDTPVGSPVATVNITRQAASEETAPPTLSITSPAVQSFIRDEDSVFITGSVASAAGPMTLTIDGQPVSLLGSTDVQTFSTQVSIADSDGEYSIVLAVTDADGRRTEQTLTVIRDTLPPSMTLDNTELEVAPTVNAVTELPYPVVGQVTETHLASLTLNGQSLALVPTGETHTFAFETHIDLPMATDTELTLLATDLADNQYALNYIVNANPATLIDLITPAVDAVLSVHSAEATLQVLARLSNAQSGMTAQLSLNGGEATAVAIQEGTIATDIAITDVNQAQQVLKLSILNSDNQVVIQTERRFTVENLDALPLSARIEPANGAVYVEPNESIRVFFDRVIDPALLELDIRESVNGLTFEMEREDNPTDFPSVDNAEPVVVNRVQELVSGELGVLPGDTAVVFQPDRFFAYGGDVYITVNYDGEQLMRSHFSMREIPTFIQANVVDQQGQPLKGIPVEIPDTGLRTVTNANGSFSFGFGLSAGQQVPSGQVKLMFNRGSQVAGFGEVRQFFYLEEGHLNRIGTTQMPLLSQDIAYRPLSSGQSSAILANGELELNLSQAQLLFLDDRSQGSVHVQFMPIHTISHDAFRAAVPQWVFAFQPAGISVDGTLDVAIQVPALQGSYDYIPDDRFYVVMVGLDSDTLTIVPTGVGVMENRRVTARLTQQQSLDYIGYALVSIDQGILEAAYEGSVSIEELMLELEQLL